MSRLAICAVRRPAGGGQARPGEVIASPFEVLLIQPEEAADQLGHTICEIACRRRHCSIAGLQPTDHCGEPIYLIGPSLAQFSAERIAGVFGPGEPHLTDLQLPLLPGLMLSTEELCRASEGGDMVVVLMR